MKKVKDITEISEKLRGERHSKITGDFGEHFLLYFLSKFSHETALIDYTGIDILATNKSDEKRMGISVKSRSRKKGKHSLDGCTVKGNEYAKIIRSCNYFNCEPWICFLIDRPNENNDIGYIYLFLIPLDVLIKIYPRFQKKQEFTFSMTKKKIEEYQSNPNIYKMKFEYTDKDWINF